MPKVFEWNGYKFFFYSNEGNPREDCHIHVRKGKNVAKFWIEPEVCLAFSWGMTSHELNDMEKKVKENIEIIKEAWNGYFN